MYSRKTFIKFYYTDAAGILFFSNIFLIAHDVYEEILNSIGYSIGSILEKENFLLPLVHVEADYKIPLRAGDEVTVQAFVLKIGDSSYTLSYRILNKASELAAIVKTVHIVVDKASGKKTGIPPGLREGLEKYAGQFDFVVTCKSLKIHTPERVSKT